MNVSLIIAVPALIGLLTTPVLSQPAGDKSHFEVVSVRLNAENPDEWRSDFGKCTGGPGNPSPSLWICRRTNPIFLLNAAFGLEVYQFRPQDWMPRDFLSISARLPANTTKAQFQEMVRNMLVERFGLVWHWRESEATVYRLAGEPGGVKLRESAPDAGPAVTDYGKPAGTTIDKSHFPVLPDGTSGLVGMGNHNRWRSSNITTADIAFVLRWEFRTDVIDETGLTGHYDVDLRWETQSSDTGPGVIPFEGPDAKTEFRNKLGLRLEPDEGNGQNFLCGSHEQGADGELTTKDS